MAAAIVGAIDQDATNALFAHAAEGDFGWSFASPLFNSACRIPICCLLMTAWKPTPRVPAKTKEELREMLAQAVRNTQPETETKPLQAKKGRR